jgi:hypothetical protein
MALEVTPELLAQLAKALGTKAPRKAKGKGRAKLTPEQSAAYSAANDKECIRIFTEAGYSDVQPRVNVLTYGKEATDKKPASGWKSKGRKVREGEKSLPVGPFHLFHIDQTDPIVTH